MLEIPVWSMSGIHHSFHDQVIPTFLHAGLSFSRLLMNIILALKKCLQFRYFDITALPTIKCFIESNVFLAQTVDTPN
jgi:hypothetical protein